MDLHVHIISKAKARELGMKKYFTGMPCRHGGYGERWVSGSTCTCPKCAGARAKYLEDNSKARADYFRKWREENEERAKKLMKDYYDENREKIIAKSREYRKENSALVSNTKRRYYQRNREQVLEKRRKYCEDNKPLVRASAARRRAAEGARILRHDCELTHLIEREAYALARERREQTGVDWHVDHMVPLRGREVSGLHHWSNLQVIPADLNRHKHNRMMYTEPFEWLKDA